MFAGLRKLDSTILTLVSLGIALIAALIFTLIFSTSQPHQHVALKNPWQETIVRPGDTLSAIFAANHLPAATLATVMELPLAKKHLNQLHPGQKILFQFGSRQQLEQLKLPLDIDTVLLVRRQQTHYQAALINKPLHLQLHYVSINIQQSLADAALKAGLDPALYQQLKSIFSGKIDYRRDLQKGDRFELLYQQFLVGHQIYHSGNIIVATFTGAHHHYSAIRFVYPKHHVGYYTPGGQGIVPRFLFPPLKYAYISSRFSYHRMDPYLHVIRPHLGIDFAANRGTPIHSIGVGTIVFCGVDGGYGNAVIIQYGQHYRALYGHTERFAHATKTNARVKRGQIIGYVGDTGWSTGPHLHFELYVNGVPRNPLKMKFPHMKSVPSSYLKAYRRQAHTLLSILKKRASVYSHEHNLH